MSCRFCGAHVPGLAGDGRRRRLAPTSYPSRHHPWCRSMKPLCLRIVELEKQVAEMKEIVDRVAPNALLRRPPFPWPDEESP